MKKRKILIVDDEEFNLDILNEYLKDEGHETILAKNGFEAMNQLENNNDIDAIILDRMMPVMDGMKFIQSFKTKDKYKNIPIIMQTAASSQEQIMEGIAAGVFYYLTKPYEKITLLTILNAALEQVITQQKVSEDLTLYKKSFELIENCTFHFRTMEEAKDLSFAISKIFPDPERVVFGLNELTVNAIEHGNLGITCDEKRDLIAKNKWQAEINRRLKMPEYETKFAVLNVCKKDKFFEITIKDMGKGFDYSKFNKVQTEGLFDPNGRGIAMSKIYSFESMEYRGIGNEVVCRVNRR